MGAVEARRERPRPLRVFGPLQPDNSAAEPYVSLSGSTRLYQGPGKAEGPGLYCATAGIAFGLPLPDLNARHFNMDDAVRRFAAGLSDQPGLRAFARASPFLLEHIQTGFEGLPELEWRDTLARLRILQVLLGALDGRQEFTQARRLLLRQHFVLLAGACRFQTNSGWAEMFKFVPSLPVQARQAQRNWAAELLDNQTANSLLLREAGVDPEIEAENLLWQPGRQSMWNFGAPSKVEQWFVDDVVRRWQLPRYDLERAARALVLLLRPPKPQEASAAGKATTNHAQPPDATQAKNAKGVALAAKMAVRALAGAWQALLLHILAAAWRLTVLGGATVTLALAFWATAAPGLPVQALIVLKAAVFVGMVVGLAPMAVGLLVALKTRMALYPLALRLAASVLVGLVTLTGVVDKLTAFAFQSLNRDTLWPTLIMMGLSALGAGIYLWTEAHSRLFASSEPSRRATRVWVYGLMVSILLTVGVSVLFAGPAGLTDAQVTSPEGVITSEGVSAEALARQMHLFPDWGMIVSPDYVFLGGCLAFAVGVLLQILWEDKAITEPL